MIGVFIAASHEIVRMGLFSALQEASDICVVGEISDQSNIDLVAEVVSKSPDVIIWDIEPDEMSVSTARHIKSLLPNSRILAFSDKESEQYIFSALAAGADGYVLSCSSVETVRTATRNVAAGAGWLDPRIAMQVLRRSGDAYLSERERSPKRYKAIFGLSEREYEILRLLVDGLSNRAIADQLFVSLETVKTHVRHIMHKLNVQTRTEVVVKAFKENLCEEGLEPNISNERTPGGQCRLPR